MKQHAEITYEEIEENKDYENIINKVIDKCFENEHLDRLNLYISINLTVPDVIHVINKKYRDVDRATDVLSFPMFEKNEIDAMVKDALENKEGNNTELESESKLDFDDCEVLGDLIISIPKVYEQAEEYGHSFERELAYMCVHGFYHLMGYDHMVESDKVVMRAKEDEVLNALGITRE